MKPTYKIIDGKILNEMSPECEYTVADFADKFRCSNQKVRGSMSRMHSMGLVEIRQYDE